MPGISSKFQCSLQHGAGATVLAFHATERLMVTAGTDTVVKLQSFELKETPIASFDVHNDAVTAVALSLDGKWFASGGEDNAVHLFDFSERKHVRLANRCQRAIKALAFSPCSTKLAVASEEGGIRILSVSHPDEVQVLSGHTGPVMALAWSFDGKEMASAGTDGSLRFWDTQAFTMGKVMVNKFPPAVVRSDNKFSIQYIKANGIEYLIVPTAAGIEFITPINYHITSTMETSNMPHPRMVAFNPNRTVMALAEGAQLAFFKTENSWGASIALETYTHSHTITDLAWHAEGTLSVADSTGVVGIWETPTFEVPQESTSLQTITLEEEDAKAKAEEERAALKAQAKAKRRAEKEKRRARRRREQLKEKMEIQAEEKAARSAFIDDEVEEDNDIVDEEPTMEVDKEENDEEEDGSSSSSDDNDEDGDDEDHAEEEAADREVPYNLRKRKSTYGYEEGSGLLESGLLDEAEDDPPQAAEEQAVEVSQTEMASEAEDDHEDMQSQYGAQRPLQATFQPGSTPEVDGKCILACNTHGVVRLERSFDENGMNTTSIVVHAFKRYRDMRLVDRYNVSMASLSPRGVILASQGEPEVGGTLLYKPLEGLYGTNQDWSITLRQGEYIDAIALGDKVAVCFTSRFLRLFTYTGLELAVISLPNRVVTTSCTKNQLAFVCDSGLGLTLNVWDLAQKTAVHQNLPLSLSGDAQLLWLGWSDEGRVATCDTHGVVRYLVNEFGHYWQPCYDPITREGGKKYWPVGLTQEKLLGISCDEDSNYPAPTADFNANENIDLKFPMAPGTNTANRDAYLQLNLVNDERKRVATYYTEDIAKDDKVLDQLMFGMFETALKKDQTARALDICLCFNRRNTMRVAMQKAHAMKHESLVKKMRDIWDVRFKTKEWTSKLPAKAEKTQKEKAQMMKRELQQLRAKTAGLASADANSSTESKKACDTEEQVDSQATCIETESAPVLGVDPPTPTKPSEDAEEPATTPAPKTASQLFQSTPSPQKTPAKKTGGSTFASFSPSRQSHVTPSSMDAAMSTLASMTQSQSQSSQPTPKPTGAPRTFVPAGAQKPTPKAAPKPAPRTFVRAPTSTPTPTPSNATTEAPTAGKPSAENKLAALKFKRNPSHTYKLPTPTTPTPTPAPTSTAPEASSPTPSLVSDSSPPPSKATISPIPTPTKIATPDVSSELSNKALNALQKRQQDEDDDDLEMDMPALKMAKTS